MNIRVHSKRKTRLKFFLFISLFCLNTYGQVSNYSNDFDKHRLLENLVIDTWTYYRTLSDIGNVDDQVFIIELMQQSANKLSVINQTEKLANETTFRFEGRMYLLLSLAEQVLDNPTLASKYLKKAYKHNGVLEGFEPENRKKLKAAVVDLEKWLATFGFVSITFSDFVSDTSFQTIKVNISSSDSVEIKDGEEKTLYANIASDAIGDSLFAQKNNIVIALKNGRYKLTSNKKEYIKPIDFEVELQDTTNIKIRPDYWFKLVIVDTLGEMKTDHVNIFFEGNHLKTSDLTHMPFGSYRFFGRKQVVVPDSLKSITFVVTGLQQTLPFKSRDEKIVFRDHGGIFYLIILPKK